MSTSDELERKKATNLMFIGSFFMIFVSFPIAFIGNEENKLVSLMIFCLVVPSCDILTSISRPNLEGTIPAKIGKYTIKHSLKRLAIVIPLTIITAIYAFPEYKNKALTISNIGFILYVCYSIVIYIFCNLIECCINKKEMVEQNRNYNDFDL